MSEKSVWKVSGNFNCSRLGTEAPSYPTASDLKANLWLLLFSENQSV